MTDLDHERRRVALLIVDRAGAEGALLAATMWLRDGNDIASLPAGEIILPAVRDAFPNIWQKMREGKWPTKRQD